jgi:hypothetical protein
MERKLKSFCVNFTALVLVYCVFNVNLGLSLSFDDYRSPIYKVFQLLSLAITIYGTISMILSRKFGIYLVTGWSIASSGAYFFLIISPDRIFSAKDAPLLVGLALHFIHFATSAVYICFGIEEFVEPTEELERPVEDIESLPIYQRKDPSLPPDYSTEGEASIEMDVIFTPEPIDPNIVVQTA